MGNKGEATATSSGDTPFRASSSTSNMPHPPTTEAAAADMQIFRGTPPYTNTPTLAGSSTVSAAEHAAESPPPRLLDNDPSRFRSLKRVIVIGRPGSGTDGVGDALKDLGFRVYDFKTASSRYERDFPLWLEAARLRQEGRPYSKSDFDKVIGDHDALVGAPACFFDSDIVKLYPGVKVILVTRDPELDILKTILQKVTSKLWQRFDPAYYGRIDQFLKLNAEPESHRCPNNDQAVREAVREKNLLVVHSLIAWVPLCEFLGVKAPGPDAKVPTLHNNRTNAELAARPRRAVLKKVKRAGGQIVIGLAYTLTMASTVLVAVLAAVLGVFSLYQLSCGGLRLYHFLAALSQVRDTTRLTAASLALLAFLCGMGAGYSIALMRVSEPSAVASHPRDYRTRDGKGRRSGGKDRGRQSEDNENKRPERPVLDEWSGVQENIRQDDARKVQEGRATLEEWSNGKHVTFHVTHKRTRNGQDLFSGPREVLSVTEETVE